MTTEIENLKNHVARLLNAPAMPVHEMITNPGYAQNRHQGVYALFAPSSGAPAYIGKTNCARDGVAQRIWDHANGISSPVTSEMAPDERELFRQQYSVRTIEIADSRLRSRVELFAIAVINPLKNRL
ncbi:MAG: hypothetical protein LBM92_07315 [Opitutaceae bacterium]|jgi:hypothetical protein|nr:hypothetical protein [Opitutaceae bacterium]